jgi:hypothetical protein
VLIDGVGLTWFHTVYSTMSRHAVSLRRGCYVINGPLRRVARAGSQMRSDSASHSLLK